MIEAVRNKINGVPVTPEELQKLLGLDSVGNMMINQGWRFSEEEKRAPNCGVQLAASMEAVHMNFMHSVILEDYFVRMAFLSQIGRPVYPINELEVLIPARDRMIAWFKQGWSMHVPCVPMTQEDFLDWTFWKFQRETALSLKNDLAVVRAEINRVLNITGILEKEKLCHA